MSHADARPVARETGMEEAQVEALLHLASTFEPERSAPSGLEASVAAKLTQRQSFSFPWPKRLGWPTLTLAGGALAAVACLWLPTAIAPAPAQQGHMPLVATSPAISAPSAPEPVRATFTSGIHPVAWSEEDGTLSAVRVMRREGRLPRRRNPVGRRWHVRRAPTVPTVRWEVEQVSHEVERTTASGWWVTQNKETGDLEAAPATLEVVSTREVQPSTAYSCAPPEQAETQPDSETMSAPGSQPSAPEENPKQ